MRGAIDASPEGPEVVWRTLVAFIGVYGPLMVSELDRLPRAVYKAHMSASDLESRYGKMVSLDELALFFHAHVRAVRNALEANRIPIFTFGRSTVVPLRLVEQSFGLQDVAVDEDFLRHEAARYRSTYRPDGSPKPIEEFVAELEADAPQWLAMIEAARERLPTTVVAGR